jgi:hypothetical protein
MKVLSRQREAQPLAAQDPAGLGLDALAPYTAIAEHAELELEHAGRGEIDELAGMAAHWEQLVAGLPPRPPDGAAELLERARMMHERTRIELMRLREAVLAEHMTATHAKRAAAGYRGEVVRPPRLDRSA